MAASVTITLDSLLGLERSDPTSAVRLPVSVTAGAHASGVAIVTRTGAVAIVSRTPTVAIVSRTATAQIASRTATAEIQDRVTEVTVTYG